MTSARAHKRGRLLRGFTLAFLVPLGCFLLNGPLAASLAYADSSRRNALLATARQQGLDPDMLLKPEAWAKRQQVLAERLRQAALATLPVAKAPAWLTKAARQVEAVQAIHSLAGALADDRAGDHRALDRLSPEAKDLYQEARRAKVKTGAPAGANAGRIRSSLKLANLPAVDKASLAGVEAAASEQDLVALPMELPPPAGATPIAQPEGADTQPTLDAQSTDALIVAKAQALGKDVIRIYNFVHDTIETEMYFGSKKGAVGTLREGRGNDIDQASLLIALLRAAEIPCRYESGTVELSATAANVYTATESLSAALTALLSSGVQAKAVSLGKGRGLGLQIAHTWVRAFVPSTAYRGIKEVATENSWVHLGPALKRVQTQKAVDLRDQVTFDFQGYLSQPNGDPPSKVYEKKVRDYVLSTNLDCQGVDGATKRRTITADALPLLPSELPGRRVNSQGNLAALATTTRHQLRFTGKSSAGTPFVYAAPMVSLWGKGVTLVYEPATDADTAKIAAAGGLENTPAYSIKLKGVLKVDGVAVATSAAETPGAEQSLVLEMLPPKTESRSAKYMMTVGGVYAFTTDPGLVPAELITERQARMDSLSGDNREAEKLNVIGLSYFRQLGLGRERMAALQWHRLFKDIEIAQASVEPRLATAGSTPVRLARDFFVFDAAQTGFGTFSVDGDNHRSAYVFKLAGFESSFLEHRISEQYKGAPAYSAISLVQLAGANTITFDSTSVDEALLHLYLSQAILERLRELADQGYTITAPLGVYSVSGLGDLYGFVATMAGSGIYEVNFQGQPLNGGVSVNSSPPAAAGGGPQCSSCGGGLSSQSEVNMLSGNYFDQIASLSLPSRGLPLSVTVTYSSLLGWHQSYDRKVEPQASGSLVFTDGEGVRWTFSVASASGTWAPPPTRFQHVQLAAGGGYDMVFPDGLRHHFDASGRLAYERDMNGHQLDVIRDGNGRITSVLGTATHALAFGYDPAGQLTRIEDTAGRALGFAYNSAGRLTTYTDVLGHNRSFTYDTAGRMRSKTDFLGNMTSIDYDDLGRAVRVQDPEGGVYKYAFDTRNRTVVHTDRMGQVHLYEIGDAGLPVRTVDPLGNETRTVYDARGNRMQERDARGRWTSSTYYDDGNLKSHTDALGNTTKYAYGTLARLTTVTDATDRVTTTNTYDPAGNLETSQDALGNTTRYTYQDGLPITISRPGPSTTAMTYDDWGNVKTMTDAANGVTTMTYDVAGHLTAMTDANNKSRTMIVDAKGRMLQMKDALQKATTFTYDDNGNRKTVADPSGALSSFAYDKLGRLIATTDALGNETSQEYNAAGQVVARTDARGARTVMKYDAIGRLVSTIDPTGASTTMGFCANEAQQPCLTVDPVGNVTTVVEDELGREVERRDALGNVTTTSYDRLGRRESVTDPAGNPTGFVYDDAGRLTSVIDALHGVTTYGYDTRGNRTSVTDANAHTTTFEYDLANRLAQEVVPDQIMTTQYGYDSAGNRTAKLDGKNQTTGFVYDANRRLTDINYAGGAPAHFAYDDRGNKTVEKNGDSERHLVYDLLGRLTHVEDITVGHNIDYTYDEAGNRTSMTVTPENETTRYFWDSRGLLSSMVDPEGGIYRFSYDKGGRRTATIYPNGMLLSTTYDAGSRVVSMVYTAKGGGVIESFSYTYDSRGNRLAKIFADGTAEEYRYDQLSRLIQATYPSGRTVQYTYDAVGNRLQMVDGQVSNSGPVCTGDKDCDGTLDNLDNCPQVSNADQTDSDRGAVPSGLRYGFLFEEPAGTLVQDAAKSFTGTIQGTGVTRVTGHSGRGIKFPGTIGAAVKIPHGPTNDITGNAISISAWVKPSGTDWGAIIIKAGQYGLYQGFGPYGFKFIKSGAPFLGPEKRMTVGVWTHAVVTWDGTNARYYVNGNLGETEILSTAPIVSTGNPVLMGCDLSSTDASGNACSGYGGINGTVDEVGVWDRVLTTEEIHALFRGELLGEDRLGDACDACPSSRDTTCAPTTCLDEDGDGYGVPGASNCAAGRADLFDCDDHQSGVHPGAAESCDGADNNCNGLVDDACLLAPKLTKYRYNAFNQLLKSGVPIACATNDLDCDGIADSLDNCPATHNPGQEDSDVPSLASLGATGAWHFDESTGTVAYDSAGTHNGTLLGGVARTVAGVAGSAISLDGSDDRVAVPSLTVGSGAYSLMVWAKLNSGSLSGWRTIMEFGNDSPYFGTADGRLTLWNAVTAPAALPVDQWVHVGYVWDGSKSKLYVGGTKVAETSTAPMRGGVGLGIGFNIGDPAWSGLLDEALVFGRGLSQSEVARLASGKPTPAGDDLGDACDPCPGNADASCRPTTCTDEDGDGYGVQGASNCSAGHSELFDCDDRDASIHHGAFDVAWDGVDNDCNGYTDEPMQEKKNYQWDGNGNLVSDGTTTYTWDARDRLVSNGYGYDTGNLRVKMGAQKVLLDGIEEAREYGGSGLRYDHAPPRVDGLLAQTNGAEKGYFVTDALGSVYGIVDSTGTEVTKYTYDVYGARTAVAEGMATGWGFTGRRQDSATEMYYRERYLIGQSGIFQSRDPVSWRTLYTGESRLPVNRRSPGHRTVPAEVLLSLSNEYQYVRASPAVFEDPTGRYWMEFTNDQITTKPYTLYLYGNWDSSRDQYQNPGDVLHVAWGAWSGYVETTPAHQCAEGVGPIPAGTYFIWPHELHKSSWLERLQNDWYEDDWGVARVPIGKISTDNPAPSCQARGGFYLHGGVKPGTAGCIDIGNRGIEDFISYVQGYSGGILLWVHYIGK